MSGACHAVQKALYAALSADAALAAAVTGIHDGVRAGADLPYLTIGPDTATDAGWKGGSAWDHRLTVTVWTAGPGAAGAKAILALASDALASAPDAVDGWGIAWLTPVRSVVTTTPDGATQGVLDVRARTVA